MLSVNRIFASSDFFDEGFDRPRWSADGSCYTTLRKYNHTVSEIMWHDVNTGLVSTLVSFDQLLPEGQKNAITIDDYSISSDRSKILIFTESIKVWRLKTKGSYWILDLNNKHQLFQLGKALPNPKILMFATLSPDSSKVAYVCEHNLYVEDLITGITTPLTSDGSSHVINGTFDWVYEEEFHLRNGFRWSPDGSSIAYWRLDQSQVPIVHLINNTDTVYPKLVPIHYPKTGDLNSSVSVRVVRIADSSVTILPLDVLGDTQRENYIADMNYHSETGMIIIQSLNRLQNHLKVCLCDPLLLTVSVVFEDKDEAWVDISHELRWVDSKSFLYLTERNGWRQICVVHIEGSSSQVKYLTSPGYDAESIVGVNRQSGDVYFIASPDSPLYRYLYRVNLRDGGSTSVRVTPEEWTGTSSYDVSKDGRFAVHGFSAARRCPTYRIISLPNHDVCSVLSTNQRLQSNVNDSLPPLQFFQVDVGVDSASGCTGVLDGWCLLPPSVHASLASGEPVATHSIPVIFYLYGEPAAQIVRDHWMGTLGLWHSMLAQQGAAVICVDNRGVPAPRGRLWRKSIYRQVGVLSSADQMAAAQKILLERPYLNPNKVAVWGWSGGGSMSLNLLFRYPDVYQTAISVAPVPDMRFYDTIYQERYMGLPSQNEEGYQEGSPITHCHNMHRSQSLLVIHGTGDDNCHYATAERLFNELIRLNKPFEMMAYPNRSHSINEGENTSRHLFDHMTTYFFHKGLLPAVGVSEEH